MEQQGLPLTPQMRAALQAHRARNARLYGGGGIAIVFVLSLILTCWLSSPKLSLSDKALALAALLGPFAIAVAIVFWVKDSRVRRGLAEGVYQRYAGPPRYAYDARQFNTFMMLGRDRVPLSLSAESGHVFGCDHVTVVYSAAAELVFAVWDEAGRVIHQGSTYDLRGDTDVAAPSAGAGLIDGLTMEWPTPQDSADLVEFTHVQQHPVAPGRYPLTPQMVASLRAVKAKQSWGWASLAFVPALIGGFFQLIGAWALFYLPLYGLTLLLFGALYRGYRNGKRPSSKQEFAAKRVSRTYIRSVGPYELKHIPGNSKRSESWYINTTGLSFLLPSTFEYDPSWLVSGEKRGTLVYWSTASYLFAIWDEDGKLVYRSRYYNLAHDALMAAPTPAEAVAVPNLAG